jgi:xanthine dehydrogenase accessory factor
VTAQRPEPSAPGRPYALATVVRVDPPVSARVGDKAVVTTDGALSGWVGGACSEPIVIREALAALAEGRPRLVRITPAEMAAGGAPAAGAAASPPSAAGSAPGAAGSAVADDAEPLPAGVVSAVSTCPSGGGLEVFVEPVGIAPRLLVAGATPVAKTLAKLAGTLGYDISALSDADLERVEPGSAGPDDSIVVATMGHYDEEALAAALRTRAGYIGLVASRRRAASVFSALRERGVGEQALSRVASPAGLDLGPSTQEEIAVAILAEVIRERHRRAAAPSPPVEQAVDPVCGMTVALAGARHSADHAGRRYWFCSEHCLHAFTRDPDRYATATR